MESLPAFAAEPLFCGLAFFSAERRFGRRKEAGNCGCCSEIPLPHRSLELSPAPFLRLCRERASAHPGRHGGIQGVAQRAQDGSTRS